MTKIPTAKIRMTRNFRPENIIFVWITQTGNATRLISMTMPSTEWMFIMISVVFSDMHWPSVMNGGSQSADTGLQLPILIKKKMSVDTRVMPATEYTSLR
jgi:hypothetical protein